MFRNASGLLFSLWVGLPHCVHMKEFLLQRMFFFSFINLGLDEEYIHHAGEREHSRSNECN